MAGLDRDAVVNSGGSLRISSPGLIARVAIRPLPLPGMGCRTYASVTAWTDPMISFFFPNGDRRQNYASLGDMICATDLVNDILRLEGSFNDAATLPKAVLADFRTWIAEFTNTLVTLWP